MKLLPSIVIGCSLAFSALHNSNAQNYQPMFSKYNATPPLVLKSEALNDLQTKSSSPKQLGGGMAFFKDVAEQAEELYKRKNSDNVRIRRDIDYVGEMVHVTYNQPYEPVEYSFIAPSGKVYDGFLIKSLVFIENEGNSPELFSVSMHPFDEPLQKVTIDYFRTLKMRLFDGNNIVTISNKVANTMSEKDADVISNQSVNSLLDSAHSLSINEVDSFTMEVKSSNISDAVISSKEYRNLVEKAGEQRKELKPLGEPPKKNELVELSLLRQNNLASAPADNSVVENTYTTSVLFIIDRRLFQSAGYNNVRQHIIDGLTDARELMYQHGNGMATPEGGQWGVGVAHFRNQRRGFTFGYEVAPASLCTTSNPCDRDYLSLIRRLETDDDVQDLRKLYNADHVLYAHPLHGLVNGNEVGGAANQPYTPHLPDSDARLQVGIWSYNAGTHVLVHELLHLLGAGHTEFNTNAPRNIPGHAYIGIDTHYNPVFRKVLDHPYRTYMEHHEVCEQFASNQSIGCMFLPTLSTAADFYQFNGNIYNIGASFNDNYWAIYSTMPRSAKWSHYYNKPN
ncbi:hypothetical protein EYS14_00145 [Alteromonadaceae bacterium M269]|nr:hypothetical protein EYS14_00145 [Alteromonadaceae bacterium M269]